MIFEEGETWAWVSIRLSGAVGDLWVIEYDGDEWHRGWCEDSAIEGKDVLHEMVFRRMGQR